MLLGGGGGGAGAESFKKCLKKTGNDIAPKIQRWRTKMKKTTCRINFCLAKRKMPQD